MNEAKEIKWGPKDCLIRFIYKLTSQKLIAFVFAMAAILLVFEEAQRAGVFTEQVAIAGLKTVEKIVIVLLAVRLGQGFVSKIRPKKNGAEERENGH